MISTPNVNTELDNIQKRMEALGTVIKDRLISVQEEINNGLKKLSLSDPSFILPADPHTASVLHHSVPSHCDLNAGAQLLHIYQNEWKAMSERSINNIERAKEADKLLQNLHQQVSSQFSQVNRLNYELRSLETVKQSVLDIQNKIGAIKKSSTEVEKSLMFLENLVEMQDFQQRKIEFNLQVMQERERRLLALEELKAQLAREHAQKLQLAEIVHSATARERQAVFEEVFMNELTQYRLHGQLPRLPKPSASEGREAKDLTDVVIEEDLSSLNSFLED